MLVTRKLDIPKLKLLKKLLFVYGDAVYHIALFHREDYGLSTQLIVFYIFNVDFYVIENMRKAHIIQNNKKELS